MKPKIILASKSPRRSQLLTWAEIEFEVMAAETDESYPLHLSPIDVAIHIATDKATAVKNILQSQNNIDKNSTILAADTIVILDNKIIGKPVDRKDAVDTLSMLSGRTHRVVTGICILAKGKTIAFAEETEVEFLELSGSQIEYYIDQYKPYDKAGAYAIQEWIGMIGIKSINGDFYNVMGLPVSRVIKELNTLNDV
ncbi:MAG: Maf family nucleotide pyrophosphatase [Ginsengibacter sp.]